MPQYRGISSPHSLTTRNDPFKSQVQYSTAMCQCTVKGILNCNLLDSYVFPHRFLSSQQEAWGVVGTGVQHTEICEYLVL